MTKIIKLTKGKKVIVDDRDYKNISKYKWWTLSPRKNLFYACRNFRDENGKRITVPLHRFIMNPTKGMQVDHIDGNTLNCTRKNLRICTNSQNNRNKNIRPDNTSGYKGVSFSKRSGKWDAHIQVDNKRIYIKRFDNPVDAAKAYDEAAKIYHGEFARLNFPK